MTQFSFKCISDSCLIYTMKSFVIVYCSAGARHRAIKIGHLLPDPEPLFDTVFNCPIIYRFLCFDAVSIWLFLRKLNWPTILNLKRIDGKNEIMFLKKCILVVLVFVWVDMNCMMLNIFFLCCFVFK